VLDVAAGTGIVSAALASRGYGVIGMDLSAGMLAVASRRLPGRLARASAAALPVADGSVGAVTMVWLLHLLEPAAVAGAVAEAARVLRPGGTLVCTVDKDAAHRGVAPPEGAADASRTVAALARARGLELVAERRFAGHGQRVRDGDGAPVYRLVAFRTG
jgi:septum formation protein